MKFKKIVKFHFETNLLQNRWDCGTNEAVQECEARNGHEHLGIL